MGSWSQRWLVGFLAAVVLMATATPAGASASPAYPGDFPDPFVFNATAVYPTTYYAFSTQVPNSAGGWINVPVRQSSDGLNGWTVPPSRPDALPSLPTWARSGNTWGPSVLQTGPSTFVLYYTVTNNSTGLQCISRGTSAVPQGPYTDHSSGPLVCQNTMGGSIDPNPFRAPDGTIYLHWKSDDNRFRNPTKLWARQLKSDGLSFARRSSTHRILSATATWENGIIEGPAMTAAPGPVSGYQYFLMYGAGNWTSAAAGIGYAICSGPLGPCTKVTTSSPWLTTGASGSGAVGPAGPSLYVFGSSSSYSATQQLAYHGWFCPPGTTCKPPTGYGPGGAVRALWINTVTFSGGAPHLQ